MKTFLYKLVIFFGIYFLLALQNAFGQCAMCRASIESSASSGADLVLGINLGIIYLASMPYIAISVIVYFWYQNSKKNVQSLKNSSN